MSQQLMDVILRICSMSRDSEALRDRSMISLLTESGYESYKSMVNKDGIMETLSSHPEFVRDWELYSDNKRTSTGWYFFRKNGKWVVGYFNGHSRENEQEFTSDREAAAVFILREVEQLSSYASH